MHYLIRSREFYRNQAPGWVAVIHGQPWHFTGPTAKKEAEAAVNQANKTLDKPLES
jgi:hypothetical protein